VPERIHKLQPNRTIALRGFDDRGAAAALHDATPTSFVVSGVFRDPADFCVLILWDADNFFEHPRLKFLPDFDFSGIVLEFDVRYEGLQPLDSVKYPTIDWPFLDVVKTDGSTARVRLFDHLAQPEPIAGAWEKASGTIAVQAADVQAFDRVTIWYQNLAFDYIAAGGETGEAVAAALAAQINGVAWGDAQAIEAEASGSNLTIRAKRPGQDGNLIRLYCQSKTPSLALSADTLHLAGGSSAATWRVKLDFSALGLDQVRQMWLTFAPAIADSAAYQATEWRAEFTNWTVTGANQWLQVAGPGSVRVEETDSWCTYGGTSWSSESGFYSKGFAHAASTAGATVTVRYHCQTTHDLWIGTSLYSDRGAWGVSLDGGAETTLDCRLSVDVAVVTRRRIRTGVAPGEHVVTLTHRGGGPCYFDFLEAAVAGDVPDALPARPNFSPAMDYGTDHTYKMPAARLLWWMDQIGFAGPLNVYVSVFWWNQRKRIGAIVPDATVTFGGNLQPGDQIFVSIADGVFGKTVFPADTAESIARHFAFFINMTSVGVWAAAEGAILSLINRAVGPAYQFTIAASVERQPGSTATAVAAGDLRGGDPGRWDVDEGAAPTLNRGAREWIADLCRECAARGRELTLSYSMELLNPPDAWAARYPDGTAVTTATGFSTNFTTHCSFVSGMLGYQKRVYLETAGIMAAAGLVPNLQFGEFLWWFFPDHGGMAYYDAETKAAALAAFGRPLHVFTAPDDSPAVNGGADAALLAQRLDSHCRAIRDHVRAQHPDAVFEILLALDVNYPSEYEVLSPISGTLYRLGGRLNYAVNVPAAWRSPDTAPFDRVKMEGLDNGAGSRNLTRARRVMAFPFAELAWPRAKCRYLVPVFNGGCPWEAEYRAAIDARVPVVNAWAHDHVHIFGWPVEEPAAREAIALL